MGMKPVTKPLYEEFGPEPTEGKMMKRTPRSDAEIVIVSGMLLFCFVIIQLLNQEAKKKGIDFNGKLIFADKWVGCREYWYLIAASCVFALIIAFHICELVVRKRARDNCITGIVVGYRKSSQYRMCPIVEATLDGKLQYVRVMTFHGEYARSYYPEGSSVEFYKVGSTYYARL